MTANLYTKADITHYTSADTNLEIQFLDSNGDAVDFSGSTFEMDIATAAGQTASYTLTTANSRIESTDLSDGTITLVIAHDALSAGSYVYDLIRLYNSPEEREMLLLGSFTVVTGVTT